MNYWNQFKKEQKEIFGWIYGVTKEVLYLFYIPIILALIVFLPVCVFLINPCFDEMGYLLDNINPIIPILIFFSFVPVWLCLWYIINSYCNYRKKTCNKGVIR